MTTVYAAVIKDNDDDKYGNEPWVYVASSQAALNTALAAFVKECGDEDEIEAYLLGYSSAEEKTEAEAEAAEYAENPANFTEPPDALPKPRKDEDLVAAFFDGEEHDTLGNGGRNGQRYQMVERTTDLHE